MRPAIDWLDGRWHLAGRGIHAGNVLEICWADGTWEVVRIETGNKGRDLYAHTEHHGEYIVIKVDEARHNMRWLKAAHES